VSRDAAHRSVALGGVQAAFDLIDLFGLENRSLARPPIQIEAGPFILNAGRRSIFAAGPLGRGRLPHLHRMTSRPPDELHTWFVERLLTTKSWRF
jgi:hypothetical protein